MHVDAAWAGVTLACPEYRETAQLPGINEYVDSLCINFHKVNPSGQALVLICGSTIPVGKWGLTNFDASAFWVRDRRRLIDALEVTPEFLRTKEGDAGTHGNGQVYYFWS